MIDLAAFITELETNPRYNDTVRRGDNAGTLILLHELEPGKTTFRTVTVAEVRATIGNGVKGLSADNMQLLNFQVPAEGEVDFGQQGVRDAIDEALTGKTGALNRIAAMRSRPRSYGEAFGDQPTLNDIRIAVRQIEKAAIRQPVNPPVPTVTGGGVFADDDPDRPQ